MMIAQNLDAERGDVSIGAHFNDESHIPFQPEIDGQISGINFDLDISHKAIKEYCNFYKEINRQQQEEEKVEISQMTSNYDNLFKLKYEYIFVFCKYITQLIFHIAGFNDKFLTSIEVFDITRGIWREFGDMCTHRTKF